MMRTWRVLILFFTVAILLSGCARFVDIKDYSEVKHMIERAEQFQDDAPMVEKAIEYEDLLFTRHFKPSANDENWFATEIKIQFPDRDMLFHTQDWTRTKVSADAAALGGRILAYLSWEWQYQLRVEDQVGRNETYLKLQRALDYSWMMCHVTGTPGAVVRFACPVNEPIEFKKRYDWAVGEGEWAGWKYRSEASPPQVSGLAYGLQQCVLYGPTSFVEKAKTALIDIANYLDDCEYQLIDPITGRPTEVAAYGVNETMILVPIGQNIFAFLITRDRDNKREISFVNRADRLLNLMMVMRCAAATGDRRCTQQYLKLCEKVGGELSHVAMEIFALRDGGKEVYQFFKWDGLLNPDSASLVLDQEYFNIYLLGFDRSCNVVVEDLPCPMSDAVIARICGTDRQFFIDRAVSRLQTIPYPKRRWEIYNSADPNVKYLDYTAIGTTDELLAAPGSVMPYYRMRQRSWMWETDPRRLDSTGGGGQDEYSYVDWLNAYWYMKMHGLLNTYENQIFVRRKLVF